MSESESKVDTAEEMPDAEGGEGGGLPDGIIRELGELGAGALVTEAGLARLLGRHPVSVKRAVSRGELPPPIRLCGGPVWLAGAIVEHLQRRMDEAAKERARLEKIISSLST
ncbi:MAG: hypothetical protein AB1696_16585 [Planctomycetota bacterium]